MENPQVKSVIFLLHQVTSQEEIITSRIRAGNCFQSNFLSLLVCQLYKHFQEKRVLEFRTGVFRYIKYVPFFFFENHFHFTQSSAAAAKSLSRVRLCLTTQTAAHQAPLSLEFSRQEHWSGLPFPSQMHACVLSCFSRV